MQVPSRALLRCPALTRRVLALGLVLLWLAVPAWTTWSVVVVDTRTGEVCVASATCLPSFDLQAALPVIVVGKGGAAAQSFVDTTGANRQLIFASFQNGIPPQDILDMLEQTDPQHQTRQYGIVDATGQVTFTGAQAGAAKFGVVGQDGDLRYAIQGNVLTGNEVVLAAETAFLTTNGDMGQRVLAAMEAARELGGDGRCSCAPNNPTGCGVPPPSFTKTAHTGFIVIARPGDTDGDCNNVVGCTSGNYYLDLNFPGKLADVDPVLEIQRQYDLWRAAQEFRPDGFLSTMTSSAQSLPATGLASATVTIRLHNIEGDALSEGGAQLLLEQVSGNPDVTVPSDLTDNGDGTYSFVLSAGTAAGLDEWQVLVDDGNDNSRPVQLWPNLPIRVDPSTDLHCGFDSVSSVEGAAVPFELLVPSKAGRPYLVLGTNKGTMPGVVFRGANLPLNPSKFFRFTFTDANGVQLPNSVGFLDGQGHASAAFLATPADLAPFIGQRLDWSAVLFDDPNTATTNCGFDVLP